MTDILLPAAHREQTYDYFNHKQRKRGPANANPRFFMSDSDEDIRW